MRREGQLDGEEGPAGRPVSLQGRNNTDVVLHSHIPQPPLSPSTRTPATHRHLPPGQVRHNVDLSSIQVMYPKSRILHLSYDMKYMRVYVFYTTHRHLAPGQVRHDV